VVITIDGPGGVGKSTVAGAVADALGLPHLDTGATYRAAALAVLRRGGDPGDPEAVLEALDAVVLGFDDGRVTIDGKDVTTDIRSAEATAAASAVAVHPEVRERIVDLQRSWLWERGGSGVVEGRDIGTVVFPDAEVKIYLTASPEVRAARRASDPESAGQTIEEIAAELRARDHADSTRLTSPLRPADDAVIVDTGDLSAEEVTALALRYVAEAQALHLTPLLAEHTDEVIDVTMILRGVVRSAVPPVTEKVNLGRHGIDYHHPEAGSLAGIFPGDESVRLGLVHGADLSDPQDLLEGEEVRVRYVTIDRWEEALREPLTSLLEEAVRLGARSS
jgi:CMP/dCMP kinase